MTTAGAAHPIARYRHALGLTQEALAARLSVSALTVYRWERGAAPIARRIPELAALFSVDPVTLLDELANWSSSRFIHESLK